MAANPRSCGNYRQKTTGIKMTLSSFLLHIGKPMHWFSSDLVGHRSVSEFDPNWPMFGEF